MRTSRVALLWLLALALTLLSAVWQRRTGPTYPVRGRTQLAGEEVSYRLLRSYDSGQDQPVAVPVAAPEATGEVLWRRYPTSEAWQTLPMARRGGELVAALPTQLPAGKLEYQVRLRRGGATTLLPPRPAVTRFKGHVPTPVLLPHIVTIFLGMLFANAAGLSALAGRPQARRQAWVAAVLLALGGLLLGPIVQKHAFDAYWTGWPFGEDLTDNKTAVAVLAWAVALWVTRGGRIARAPLIGAALVTLVVFAIPHSLHGSQRKWEEPPATSAAGPPGAETASGRR